MARSLRPRLALGLAIPLGVLAQGGYDTHANQAARHGRVLSELAAALAAFAAGLERLPNGPAVTLLAVSEFGRRLRENGGCCWWRGFEGAGSPNGLDARDRGTQQARPGISEPGARCC